MSNELESDGAIMMVLTGNLESFGLGADGVGYYETETRAESPSSTNLNPHLGWQ
jgi:hypothetical protein